MHKTFLKMAAIAGGLGVALGAFGAHGLRRVTSDASILSAYETAVKYQLLHAVVLLGLAALAERNADRLLRWSANCILIGIILFSGSLYLLTYFRINESEAGNAVGPITPVGGLFLVLGWLFLLVYAVKKK
jgi:uncharacterized membrane protein YgdD (TMEM256/DUF423 family)